MSMNKTQIKLLLDEHRFEDLFIDELGWNCPEKDTPYPVQIGNEMFKLQPIAFKHGFYVFHCKTVPPSALRSRIETALSRDIREHIIIFADSEKQRWQWVRRVSGQPLSRREHVYMPNQPMLLIEKLCGLEITINEEEEIDLFGVFEKVKSSFNIDKVTKKFYDRFQKEHDAFLGFIDGVEELGDKKWYTSVMLNRLMFIYFIQKKGFLDGDTDYLRTRLAKVQTIKGKDKFHTFYRYFLLALCHKVLAIKESNRKIDKELAALIGDVPYLNGGVFQPHELEKKYGDAIEIPDEAFEKVFTFFDQYEWHLDNREAAKENEINPDVLGYIFEKYINQKQMGAYYTKEDITEYISKNTIIPCLFNKAQKSCKIAFEGETSVWNILRDDPDRYIYPAVRHGVSYDVHNKAELNEPVPYPKEIAVGLDTSKPDLLERRKKWNTPTPPEAGLPTEIWRETVARRQRYEEVRGKLERGEVQSINDLITLNLDIRQFAQDVINRCESPDLLNAFWVAIAGRMPQHSNEEMKPGITVLDPTCGSGAFLFAALNILEPLYEACLDRMEGFLEEWGDHPKHINYASFFSSIREDIGKHPSHSYFIYKSIIINNLYGVDIMKEATEICKLRLFLKLVAQVDGGPIEPLPDIDFNIRSGNTLVGFATQDQMEKSLSGDLLAYQTVLPEILKEAEECDRHFILFRKAQLEGDGSLVEAKANLSSKLGALTAQLNQYLADDYGIDRRKKNAYSNFLESHQPFHWFIEFYGIMKAGGFDAIIGNPPYVEYSKVRKEYKIKRYITEECGNLYAFVMERSLKLLSETGGVSLIVPHSLSATYRSGPIQSLLLSKTSGYYSYYTRRPGKLFSGADQCLCIFLGWKNRGHNSFLNYSTGYRRWYTEEREFVFDSTQYFPSDLKTCWKTRKVIPKTGFAQDVSILNKLNMCRPLASVMTSTRHDFYCHRIARYFIKSTNFVPYFCSKRDGVKRSDDFKAYGLIEKSYVLPVVAVLNSTLFYWFWRSLFDGYHCGKENLGTINFDPTQITLTAKNTLTKLAETLMTSFRQSSVRKQVTYKGSGLVEYDEFDLKPSKPIIDKIDKVLAKHYGFTDEELDYIINYDIKYRMGKELQG